LSVGRAELPALNVSIGAVRVFNNSGRPC